jgi:hypothetical protein
MSATDNWIKLYRWWQEHLKSRFISSSSMINNDNRRSSLISYHLIKNNKKRSSYDGIDEHQFVHNNFRHVRDSIRGRNSRTTRMTSTNKRSVNQKVHAFLNQRIYIYRNQINFCLLKAKKNHDSENNFLL